MNSHRFVDAVFVYCIVITILVFKSLETLLTFKPVHVIKDEREILMQLTNKELRAKIGKLKGVSGMNKMQLVEVLVSGN